MFKIQNGKIYHTRGDTADFDLNIIMDEGFEEPFEAVLSVKKTIKDSEYAFQVRADSEGHISIPHSKTQYLPYGEYIYDIEIRFDDGSVEGKYLTIGPYPYFLTPDVTVL